MSSRRPAASASAVRWRSSGDGVGSPDGWLWTRITPAALSRTASRNSSPTRTSEARDVALVDGRDPEDVVLRVEHHDPQLLALEAAHLEDQPVGDVVRAADRPAAGGPVGEQPAAELEGRHELGGLGLADPADLGQLRLASPGPGRSGRRGGRAHRRQGRPPIGRASRSPTRARSARPPVSPPRRAAQPLARPLVAGARGSPVRVPLAGSPPGRGGRRRRRRDRATADLQRATRSAHGRPRARTTGARQFPPPSGPRGRRRAYATSRSPAAQPSAAPRLIPAATDGLGLTASRR